MLPRISVFLLVYQQAAFIRETLESVLLQDYPNLEIVVGDDGSTDGTQEILREYDDKYPGLFKLLLSPVNVGITANSNKILAACSGDYVALLGGDDLWLPGKLHKQIAWFANNPDAALCHTKTEEFENSTGATISFIPDRATPNNAPAGLGEFLKRTPGYVGSSFLIPRWAIPASGFDERVKWVSDWLFLLDVLAKGRMGYIDEVLTRYRRHGDNTSSKMNEMFLDVMRACDIAEEKYPDHSKDITAFRADWVLVYMHSKRLWRVLLSRIIMKGGKIVRSFMFKALRKKERRADYQVNKPVVNLVDENREKTNVLLALPFMVTGGADEVLLRLLGHLSQKNFAFSCITTLATDAKISGDNSQRYEKITPEIYHLHEFLHGKREKRDFIFHLIETKGIEIIFIVGCSYLYPLLPEIKRRYPHVKIVDQLFNPFGHIINNRRFSRLIDLNIVANDNIEKILVNWFREKKEKVKVIRHGVDVRDEFSPERFQEKYPRNPDWKSRPDDFVVGFFGRFSKEKCPLKFVDIAARLQELRNVTWVMTGGGPQSERVRARIASRGLEKSILTPGIVADVKPYLAGTHVVVIPSLIEGIPILLMEAMSLGIPVVASRVGGIPDVITDGHNGFLCASGDIDGFAARVKLLHDDRLLREEMGKNARDFAVKNLDVGKMLEIYYQEFMKVKNQCRGGGDEA